MLLGICLNLMKKIKEIWEKIKKPVMIIAKVMEWAIFAVLILIFLAVLSPLLPTKKYLSTFIVASGSMQPTIKTGSVAVVQPIKYKEVKKDDIIIFTSPENPNEKVLHRVNQVVNDGINPYFITKGDNNNVPDNWKVYGVQVQDKFITSIPYLGFPAAFIKKPLGFALLVGIPALLLIILEIRQIKLGIEEEVKKRTEKILNEKKSAKTSHKLISIIIFTFILNALALWKAHGYAQAVYTATSTVNGVAFSVIDFIPPSIPTGLRYLSPAVACGGATNSYTITADWNDSSAHGSKNIDHYEYESYNPITGSVWGPVNVSASQRAGAFTVGHGTYGFRVRAVDNLGYMSDWTSTDFATSCQVTYSLPTPPAPTLVSPTNNSAVNTNGLIMDWADVTGDYNNPLYYIYQSARNAEFSPVAYTSNHLTSSQIPASGTPDGDYWWHVKACDALNNCSDWSEVWKMTVDSTIPTSVITYPFNSNGDNEIKYTYLWNGKVEGTASDNLSGINHVELSIYRSLLDLYWNDTDWVKGSETGTRVTATLNSDNSWSYQFNNQPPLGRFLIIAHAFDNAGNQENSATIEFDNEDIIPSSISSDTPTPTDTPEDTASPIISSPTETSTPMLTPTPTPMPTIDPQSTPTPTPTDIPNTTPSPTDSPTETLISTSVPTPIDSI